MGARGAGSGPPGPRDRFVYKHCRAPAAACRETLGGAGPRVGEEELCEKPGKSRVRALEDETWTPGRCFFLSTVSARSASVGGPGEGGLGTLSFSGDAGSPLETLGPGAPPPRPLLVGDWPPSKLPGALGRPWAEVTAAEFLPGRFPEPPHCPCQGGGRRVLSCPTECRGLSSEYLLGTGAEGQPRPLTASSSPSLAADLLGIFL